MEQQVPVKLFGEAKTKWLAVSPFRCSQSDELLWDSRRRFIMISARGRHIVPCKDVSSQAGYLIVSFCSHKLRRCRYVQGVRS